MATNMASLVKYSRCQWSQDNVHQALYKQNLWVKFMRTFGEAGTARTGKDGKVSNCGITILFLGYVDKHEGNCYQMLTPPRNSVVDTRDVTWLHCMCYKKLNTNVTDLDHIVIN